MIKFEKFMAVCFCLMLLVSGVWGATYTVTKTTDSNDGTCNSDCSLREAIGAANATPDNDVIEFDSMLFGTPQTVILTLGEIVIANNGSLTLNGTGADKLTIDGNLTGRILSSSGTAIINNAKFTRGTGAGAANTGRAGAIYNNGGNLTLNNLIITGNTASTGGGTNNAGTGSVMTINNCIISNNTSTSSGGGMQNFSTSTLFINNSTISGNTSGGTTGGGAMQANGNVRITNSTITGNNAPGGSGAIAYNGVSLILTNVTIAGNTSTNNGGGIHKSTTTLNAFVRNSIIAGNNGAVASPDITGVFSSEGNNLIGNVGTSSGWVKSDLQNTNPVLSPLGFYGGLGLTYLPLSGSPAINGGQNCVTDLSCATNNPPTAVTADQRGAVRPANSTVDIGAVETNSNYTATLPSAVFNQPYNFTLAGNFSGFTYSVIGGSFGGILLTSGASSATLGGSPTQIGVFNAVVQVSNGLNFQNINYSLTVTGTLSIVSGKVRDALGNGVKNAVVQLTDANMTTVTVKTNQLGNYSFDAVPLGGTYSITAAAKGLNFPVQMFTADQPVNNISVTALNVNFNEFK